MAKTVNEAFDTFLKEYVRLDKSRTDIARSSKGNLLNEIGKFPNDGEFPLLYPDGMSIDYGSFSRKTKIRPLDDIDIMIILNAEGNWRNDYGTYFQIEVQNKAVRQLPLCNAGTAILNSIKVINKFKDYLNDIPYYEKADIKRNQEAVTLKLRSYEWVYDIVPCFMTAPLSDGSTFYLIPDGKGNWKATDPRVDKERTLRINSKQTVSVVDVIRIIKYWTKRSAAPTMKSYYLENLILNYYESDTTSVKWIDIEIPLILQHIYHNIHKPLYDPKGFQGDINHLTYEERLAVEARAKLDYDRSITARQFENDGNMEDSIKKWGEIFGFDFPTYTTER